MKRISFALIFLLSISYTFSQEQFPHSWLGTYEGNYIIFGENNKMDTVPTSLEFLPTENPLTWTFKMTYSSKKWGTTTKDYLLKQDSILSNTFYIDEKNGIQIQEKWMNNILIGQFQLDSLLFQTRLEKRNQDELYYEIICSKLNPTLQTVYQPTNDLEKPFPVDTHQIYAMQAGIFKRKKK